jgi:uncharacterized DUF497 family protein
MIAGFALGLLFGSGGVMVVYIIVETVLEIIDRRKTRRRER